MSTEPLGRRSERASADRPDLGFHQSWYAVALSHEVAPGKVIGRDFLDGRVVIFRGEDGAARVMSAYCSHLGADLSVGSVVGNEIRCAFHHWQYGDRGRCTRIPASESIPPRAGQLAFPTAERWGLIWAFNGPEPLFDPPAFRSFGPDDLAWRVAPYPVVYPVEPWVLISNSHDLQHLIVLHKLKFPRGGLENIAVGQYTLEHDIAFETPDGAWFEQKVRVIGTNTVAFTRKSPQGVSLDMWTGTPMSGGRTRGYIVSAAERPPADDPGAAAMVEQILAMTHGFISAIIQEDDPIMMTIRFREGVLVSTDRELALYLKYVRAFPRANPLADHM